MESSTLSKLRRCMPRLLALGSALTLIAGLAGVSDAQVTFSKVLNNTVSDPLGGFFDPDPNSPIAIDGNNIVFRNLGVTGPEMWSSDLTGSSLTNLANRSSLLPGLLHTGKLSDLDQAPPLARNGLVLFSAADHSCLLNVLGNCGGLWATPAGAISYALIANGSILDPSLTLTSFFFGS